MSLRIKEKGKWVAVDIDCSLRSDKLSNERAISLIGDFLANLFKFVSTSGLPHVDKRENKPFGHYSTHYGLINSL